VDTFFRKYHFEGSFDFPNFTQDDQHLILNKLENAGVKGGFAPIPNGGIALLVISDKFTGKSDEERKSIVMNEIGNYKPKSLSVFVFGGGHLKNARTSTARGERHSVRAALRVR
jgi:hypothetical protein